jgi:hypothetical protein
MLARFIQLFDVRLDVFEAFRAKDLLHHFLGREFVSFLF